MKFFFVDLIEPNLEKKKSQEKMCQCPACPPKFWGCRPGQHTTPECTDGTRPGMQRTTTRLKGCLTCLFRHGAVKLQRHAAAHKHPRRDRGIRRREEQKKKKNPQHSRRWRLPRKQISKLRLAVLSVQCAQRDPHFTQIYFSFQLEMISLSDPRPTETTGPIGARLLTRPF